MDEALAEHAFQVPPVGAFSGAATPEKNVLLLLEGRVEVLFRQIRTLTSQIVPRGRVSDINETSCTALTEDRHDSMGSGQICRAQVHAVQFAMSG